MTSLFDIYADMGRQRANLAAGVGGLLVDTSGNLYEFSRDNPESVGLLAGQFVPGAGTADFKGKYRDPFNPSEFLPSAGQNIAQGNYLDALFQSLGLLGDVLYGVGAATGVGAIPGAVLSAPRAAQLLSDGKPFIRELPRPQTEKELETLARYSKRTIKDPTEITDPILASRPIFEPTNPMVDKVELDPTSLLGTGGINLPGDRTLAGLRLLGVNDKMFDIPVDNRGGMDFMRETGEAWASAENVINSMIKNASEFPEEQRVLGLFGAMGPRSSNFSDMVANTLVERTKLAVKSGDLDIKDVEAFDDAIRSGVGLEKKPKTDGSYKFPEWPGILDPKAREALEADGQLRIQLTKLMEKQSNRKKGFPDVAETRAITTEPDLLYIDPDLPLYGMNIAEIDRANPLIAPDMAAMPHPAYAAQLRGNYLGSLRTPLPINVAFPDYVRGRRELGIPMAGDRRSSEISSISQTFDENWVENALNFEDLVKRIGMEEYAAKYMRGEIE